MDAYRSDIVGALNKAIDRLRFLTMAADCRLPIGEGARGLECAKAGAFLAETVETVDQLCFEMMSAFETHLASFCQSERENAATAFSEAAAPLIDALRIVARSYGLDSHDTLRKRYKEQP